MESLTTARSASLNRNEPTDAIRAVNAVLTQVDHIRRRNNIFIFTTSNITQASFVVLERQKKTILSVENFPEFRGLNNCIYCVKRHLLQYLFGTGTIIVQFLFYFQSLDEAFTDRTDLSRFVGYPSANAVYAILCSCIQEMQRVSFNVENLVLMERSFP